MLRSISRTQALLASIIFLLPAAASAGTVVGAGTSVVSRAPDTLRVRVDIVGQGESITVAVAQLKQVRQAAEEKLLKLGAAKDSLKTQPAKEVVNENAQQQMDHLVRARLSVRSTPGGTAAPAAGPASTVSATLTADWPLAGDDAEARLIAAHTLRGKIKAALEQAQPAKKLSPEEQEALEETIALETPGVSPMPGQPVFLFVKKLSEAERDAATSDAFKKARREAESLSKAAGLKLGAIEQLTSSLIPDESANDYNNAYAWQMQAYARAAQGGSSDESELIGADSGAVSTTVQVSATFRAE